MMETLLLKEPSNPTTYACKSHSSPLRARGQPQERSSEREGERTATANNTTKTTSYEPNTSSNPRSVATPQTTLQCDICVKKDGWKGMLLQQCCKCRVCVHEECYGVEETKKKDKNWVCLACRAVGTDIEGWTLEGKKRKVMTVTERPVECVLCPVTGGVHAMHALYHYWGKTGRQAILPAFRTVPQRLAWVHTLCALSVCQYVKTRGTVYGCDENGDYEAEGCTAYFVMCGLNGSKEDEKEYMKTLNEHRELKCYMCGHQEKTAGRNLRVPIQCRAGDEDEFADFKKYHKDDYACTQAMHVGCAMWGLDGFCPQEPRQVWFFPGSGEEGEVFEDPVAEIFCECHAKQMGASMTGLRRSSVDKTIGSTLLERTLCEPEDLELPLYADAVAAESLTKNPRMASPMVSKLAKDASKRRGSNSSKTIKPSEGTSAACATLSEEGTQKGAAPIAAAIPRRASDSGAISKGTKRSDGAASSARRMKQTPAPLAASVPPRASATNATRADDIAYPSGGTAGTASLSTVPLKATPTPSTPEAGLPTSRESVSSKPSKRSSAACAAFSEKGTQKSSALIAASIPRRTSVTSAISKVTKPSDSAASSARGVQQTFMASFPRRTSATDATRTDNIADPTDDTACVVSPSRIPRKVTLSPSTSIPKVSPLSAKQRANLIVPSLTCGRCQRSKFHKLMKCPKAISVVCLNCSKLLKRVIHWVLILFM